MKKFLLMSLYLLLAGCESNTSYDYLMLHPWALKKQVSRCENVRYSECDIVFRAAEDFTQLLNERRDDPEGFGLKIIRAQQELAHLSPYTKAYKDQQQKIAILYAVVVVTSGGG